MSLDKTTTMLKSVRRQLFRSALMLGLLSGASAARASDTIVLPAAIPGDSRPVLVLGGIEPASTSSSDESQAMVKPVATRVTQPPVSVPQPEQPAAPVRAAVPALKIQPAIKAVDEPKAAAEVTVTDKIQRRPESSAGPRPPIQQRLQVQRVDQPRDDDRADDSRPDSDRRATGRPGSDRPGPGGPGPQGRGPNGGRPGSASGNRQDGSGGPQNDRGPRMQFVPGPDGPATDHQPPVWVQRMAAGGQMPPLAMAMHLGAPAMDPDKALESPALKKILSLMQENMELKAQLKIHEIETKAAHRIHELEKALQEQQQHAKPENRELHEQHAHLERMRHELEQAERNLDQQRHELDRQREEIHRRGPEPGHRPDGEHGAKSDHNAPAGERHELGRVEVRVVKDGQIEAHVIEPGQEHSGKPMQIQVIGADDKAGGALKALAQKLAQAEAAKQETAANNEALTKRINELEHRSRLLEEKAKALSEEHARAEKHEADRRQAEKQRAEKAERESAAKARAEAQRRREEDKKKENELRDKKKDRDE